MIQFAVWGAGILGKIVIEMLGEGRVAAIIDSNEDLQGSTYKGISVLSYGQYQEDFRDIPIIITPKGYEEEIIKQLNQMDKWIAFRWLKEIDAMRGFWMQAPKDKIMEFYKEKERIAIYGDSLLSIILTFFFRDNGYHVDNVFPEIMDTKKRKYYEEIFEINSINIREVSAGLVLAQELTEADKAVVKEQGLETDSFYDLGLKKELYYNPAIERFKGIHQGERCFIVATGPSLKMEDLDTLYEHNVACISMNGILKAFDKTKWRPDYYVVSDPVCTMAWRKEILELEVKGKFISDVAWTYGDEGIAPHLYKWHLQLERYEEGYPDFSEDFSRLSYLGQTVTYEGALQLAVYMGFKEIYLLGVDCTTNGVKMEHFVKDYISTGWSEINRQKGIRAYQTAKRYADGHGIKIYNATRGGELEVFERRDFDSLW